MDLVLVLAKQDLQGLAVSHKDHKLGLSSVEGLGGLNGSLSQLLVVGGLLKQVEE